MDELTLNRLANQLGTAMVNMIILQGQNEALKEDIRQLEIHRLDALTEVEKLKLELEKAQAKPEKPELV